MITDYGLILAYGKEFAFFDCKRTEGAGYIYRFCTNHINNSSDINRTDTYEHQMGDLLIPDCHFFTTLEEAQAFIIRNL